MAAVVRRKILRSFLKKMMPAARTIRFIMRLKIMLATVSPRMMVLMVKGKERSRP